MSKPVKCRLPLWKVGSSTFSQVKPKTYTIDTYLHLALIGYDNGWLVNYQDNITTWNIGAGAGALVSQWSSIKSP